MENFEEVEQSFNTQIPFIDIHVMVVDDDATTLAIISAMLKSWRYGVVTAKNPFDALDTLRKRRGSIDLVLTDLHMPHMNGFELQTHVKQEFKLPVIVMSADNRRSVVSRVLDSGAAFYLAKPLSLDDLKNLWQYAVTAKKGKSIVVEEIIRSDLPNFEESLSEKVCLENVINSVDHVSIVNEEKHEKKKYNKRKGTEMTKEDQYEGTSMAPKKAKVVWTNSLHNRFLMAIRHTGLDRAVPKRILEFMNVPGLTRENVASHLQKYRIFLRKVAEIGALEGLSERALRSTFASELSSLFLRNLQNKIPLDLEQHQLRRLLGTRYGDTIAAPNASSQVPHRYSSLEASSSNSLQPQVSYEQSSIAPYNVLAHWQNQEEPVRNKLWFGQSSLLNGQANSFNSPILGCRYPLYEANQAHYAGSNFPEQGLLNARNSLVGYTNRTQMYPQQIQANLGGLSTGSNLPLNSNYYPRGDYAGNQVNNWTGLVGTGQAGIHNFGVQNGFNNGYGLIKGDQGGNTCYVLQGGTSSSAEIQSTYEQIPPALHQANRQENISRCSAVEQLQYGIGNTGGGQHNSTNLVNDASTFNNTTNLVNDAATFNNFTYQTQELEENDLVERFLLLSNNDPACEPQSEEIFNPDDFIIENETDTNCPTGELLNSSLESSYNVEQSLGQPQKAVNYVTEPATGNNNMNLPNDFPSCFGEDSNLQQGNEKFMETQPFGVHKVENAASGNNPSMNWEFDMDLIEALFGTEANLK